MYLRKKKRELKEQGCWEIASPDVSYRCSLTATCYDVTRKHTQTCGICDDDNVIMSCCVCSLYALCLRKNVTFYKVILLAPKPLDIIFLIKMQSSVTPDCCMVWSAATCQ